MRSWTCLAILTAIVVSDARAQVSHVEEIDPAVSHLVTGGLWSQGAGEEFQTGAFRVVTVARGWEHLRHHVFVQWLLTDEDEMREVLVETAPLAALNEEDAWSVQKVTFACQPHECIASDAATLFDLVVLNAYDLSEEHWRVALGQPGEVQVLSRD